MKLNVKHNQIVTPGEKLGTGYLSGYNTYKDGETVRSRAVGVVRVKDNTIHVVLLSGQYIPKAGDGIIGTIFDIQLSGWLVDINSPYQAFLPLSEGVDEYIDLSRSDLTEYYDIGDVIYAKIKRVTKGKNVNLTMLDRVCRKLKGGNIIMITPTKVPRLIGKGGSMIEMIKNKTNSFIIVGQNGSVWTKGEHIDVVTEAIQMIETKSHIEGLTDEMEKMLEERMRGKNEE